MADFVTFYMLVAGSRAMTREELERLSRPLVGALVTTPMRSAIQAVAVPTPVIRVTTERDPDTGETFTAETLEVPSGPFAGLPILIGTPTVAAADRARYLSSRFITGVKWHMRVAHPPITDAQLASARSTIREQVYAPLRAMGLNPFFFTMQRSGRALPNDRGVPPTPPIPGVLDALIAFVVGTAAVGGAIHVSKRMRLP